MRQVAQPLLIGIGALTALALALAILILPVPFYAGYGIDLDGQTSLLNELKAPAIVIMALGVAMAAGLIRANRIRSALTAGTLLYLGFGLARVIALITDGPPSAGLIWVMAAELLLGLFFALALWRHKRAVAG